MAADATAVIVARCGLVCSNCGAYRRRRCAGCHSDKPMFRGCPVKACSIDRQYETCANCTEFQELRECRKLHNPISRLFGFIFRSNRIGNLEHIRAVGLDTFKMERLADGRK